MRTVLLVLVALLITSTASAQGPDLDRARRHFEAGSQAYSKGDYPRAEIEFRAAYAITKDPLLYYNIAQAQQRRGHLEDAIKSYRAYLAGVPDADDRADIDKLVRKLEAQLAGPVAPPPPPPRATHPEAPASVPASQPKEEGNARRQTAWIAGGASVVLLGVGIAMSAMSNAAATNANTLISARDPYTGQPLRFSDIAQKYSGYKDDASRYGGVAIGMYVAAAAGAGLTAWLFLTSKPAGKEKPQAARLRILPEVSPRSAGLAAGMEF
jgi:tetratricopeptide (TPR) repeat protein